MTNQNMTLFSQSSVSAKHNMRADIPHRCVANP